MSKQLEFNIKWYPWYLALTDAMAWLPIFFLYFSQFLSLKEVILLESVYYFSVVLLEVPSGYFSDKIGRKPTLLISTIGFCVSYLLFLTGYSLAVLAVAQVLLAFGMSFRSGTETSFHFESLKALGRESEYGDREAKVGRYSQYAGGMAALFGGLAGYYSLALGYLLSFVTAFCALMLVVQFTEPAGSKEESKAAPFFQQLKNCVHYLNKKPLGSLFLFTWFLFVMIHVPYEFYQPYLKQLEVNFDGITFNAAVASGILYALTRFVSGWAAGKSIQWRDKLGMRWLLLSAFALEVLVIGVMSLVLHPLIIAIFLFRSLPSGMTRAPIVAVVSPVLSSAERATYFSIQSLSCRLGFALLLIFFSFLPVSEEVHNWPDLSMILQSAAGLGVLFFVLLFVVLGKQFPVEKG